jgi:hypothetical protein
MFFLVFEVEYLAGNEKASIPNSRFDFAALLYLPHRLTRILCGLLITRRDNLCNVSTNASTHWRRSDHFRGGFSRIWLEEECDKSLLFR